MNRKGGLRVPLLQKSIVSVPVAIRAVKKVYPSSGGPVHAFGPSI